MLVMGAFMLIPAAVDYSSGSPNVLTFLFCAAASLFLGGGLSISSWGKFDKFGIRDGAFLTTVSWLVFALAGAAPLYFADINISFTDAFFESVSGITTTGSTVLVGLDSMSPGVLLWRAILQGIGGMGIIAFAMLLFPFLNVGGMQLFQAESSDRSDKFVPKARELVLRLIAVYVLLCFLCALAFYFLGMSLLDAVAHAFGCLSTGGFGTHDASFAYFKSIPMHLVATVFMFLGSLPFVLFVKHMFLAQFTYHKDTQTVWFLAIIAATTAVIVAWLVVHDVKPIGEAFVLTVFNIVSVISTTGYASTDYTIWSPFVTSIFFFLTYVGGCTGSTAGGVKIMRLIVAFKTTKRQFVRLIYPHVMLTSPHYQGKLLDTSLTINVMAFMFLYVVLNVFLVLGLLWTGLDIETAFSGAATAIANVGPGIGSIIGPVGNFQSLPDSATWLLSFGMLLGRLEILTVLVLFSPHFWRY